MRVEPKCSDKLECCIASRASKDAPDNLAPIHAQYKNPCKSSKTSGRTGARPSPGLLFVVGSDGYDHIVFFFPY